MCFKALCFAATIVLIATTIPAQTPAPLQAGILVRPDTVTVGEHFMVTVRVRAPRGAIVEFPSGSGETADTVVAMVRRDTAAAEYVESVATYRLAAWDTGRVALPLDGIVVRQPSGSERNVTLDGAQVYVRSVLPADSSARIPRPARLPIPLRVIPWVWIAIATAVVALAAAVIWWWRRRTSSISSRELRSPLQWAESEFAKIQASGMLDRGEYAGYTISMLDVMRHYLIRRFPELQLAATTRELSDPLGRIAQQYQFEGDAILTLFERGDLLKFAGARISADDARVMGDQSVSAVKHVEEQVRAVQEAARNAEQRDAQQDAESSTQGKAA